IAEDMVPVRDLLTDLAQLCQRIVRQHDVVPSMLRLNLPRQATKLWFGAGPARGIEISFRDSRIRRGLPVPQSSRDENGLSDLTFCEPKLAGQSLPFFITQKLTFTVER